VTTPHNELKTLDTCIFVELLSAAYTDKKGKENFPHISGNSEGR
jgi:hypothetical protein